MKSYTTLGIVAALLFLGELLIMNDFTTLLDGAEATVFEESFQSNPAGVVASSVYYTQPKGGIHLFGGRLIGVLLLVLSFYLYYWIAKPIFGQQTVLLNLILLATTFTIPNLAKFATSDIWAFCFQTLAFLSLLRYLKQPQIQWGLLAYFFLGLSVVLAPVSSFVFLTVSSIMLYIMHPQGKRLWRLNPWAPLIVVAVGGYYAGWVSVDAATFLLPYGLGSYGWYLLAVFGGSMMFLGFYVAGIRDLAWKMKKQEELATIQFIWIIAGLIGQSLSVLALLAFMAAKQMQVYFLEKYPNRSYVQFGAILHMALVFILALYMMISGFGMFKGLGFRAGLASGGIYWIASLVGLLGLFIKRPSMVFWGVCLSGLLGGLLFWVQWNPLLETKRNIPNRVVEMIQQEGGEQQPVTLFIDPDAQKTNVEVVGKQLLSNLKVEDYSNIKEEKGNWVANSSLLEGIDSTYFQRIDTIHIEGWDSRLRKQVYVFKK